MALGRTAALAVCLVARCCGSEEPWAAQKQWVLSEVRALNALHRRKESQSPRQKKRLGVCVTGQLGRLELESKVRNVFQAQDAVDVDVVFVLAPETTVRFVNKDTDTGGRRDWTNRSLRAALRNVSFVLDVAAQEPDPFVDEAYLKMSNKPELGADRVRSHVRQWLSLLKCWRHFADRSYDYFLKLRDDSFVIEPWNVVSRTLLPEKGATEGFFSLIDSSFGHAARFVVPSCLGFGGVNDKVALMDAGVGSVFFARPAFEYFSNVSALRLSKGNPESFLAAVLRKYAVNVTFASGLPVFTSRVAANNRSCFLFDERKLGASHCWPEDCHARQRMFCSRCPTSSGVGRRRVGVHNDVLRTTRTTASQLWASFLNGGQRQRYDVDRTSFFPDRHRCRAPSAFTCDCRAVLHNDPRCYSSSPAAVYALLLREQQQQQQQHASSSPASSLLASAATTPGVL